MTRFARAKGSKSSNERVPENATPWQDMKKKLVEKYKSKEENKKKEQAEAKRMANYNSFLQDEEEKRSKNTKWAEFPGVKKHSKVIKAKKKLKHALKDKISKKDEAEEVEELDSQFNVWKSKIDETLAKIEFKNSVRQNGLEENDDNSNDGIVEDEETDDEDAPQEISAKITPKVAVIKKQKQKRAPLKITVNAQEEMQTKLKEKEHLDNKNNETIISVLEGNSIVEQPKKVRKKKNKTIADESSKISDKPPLTMRLKEDLTEEEKHKLERKLARRLRQKEKRKLRAEAKKESETVGEAGDSKKKGKKVLKQSKKNKVAVPKKSVEEMTPEELARFTKKREKHMRQKEKRKLLKDNKNSTINNTNNLDKKSKKNKGKLVEKKHNKDKLTEKMSINGRDVEIAYVEGFPVLKEDATRLKQLRQSMKTKGIPASEIKKTLQLERRKAEKALTRIKKSVCFNCRMSGHNLSECPKLNSRQDTIGTGICFKCGSTEHTHFQCKVVRNQEYKYAQCFICKEQGHISSQCPDNPKGLYPKGGSCRLCGEVTHLKKDCPKSQIQNEASSLNAQTIDDANIEALDIGEGKRAEKKAEKKNKIIMF